MFPVCAAAGRVVAATTNTRARYTRVLTSFIVRFFPFKRFNISGRELRETV
jgi:hypothetical protein